MSNRRTENISLVKEDDEQIEEVEIEEVTPSSTGRGKTKGVATSLITKKILQHTEMSEADKKKWKSRTPGIIVTVAAILTTYVLLWGWVKTASLAITHYHGKEVFLLPNIFGKFSGVHFLIIPPIALLTIVGWLLSTRVPKFQSPRLRVFMFFNMIFANAGILISYGMTKVQNEILPFFYARIDRLIETNVEVDEALFGEVQDFFFMVELIPLLAIGFMAMFVVTKYRLHDQDIKKAFFEFKWTGERLRKFEEVSKLEEYVIEYPNIELGISKKTNEMVVLPGFDRALNTIITGSIGTGKTAALGLPVINQDLHYITRFINLYPTISKMENYISEEVQGRFLNGLSVIEPSNDLCQKVYKLAKAHGIADEAITYINPMDPNTPNINPMKGPTEKVAEVFTQVIEGLADNGGGGNFFFQQAQRNHLKQFIYLLKTHNPEKEVTFDMLIDMYNNTQLVHEMHEELKRRFPPDFDKIDKIKYRDEYNHWQILKGVDEWFDNVIVPKEERTAKGNQKIRTDDGMGYVYEDKQAEFVQGLRNILNDISANIYIRRVLFGTSEFDFDKHMGREGGILLVNTAKGDLEKLGSVLGKIVLMTLQNASFRREANVSTFHHILVDEAPEYLYGSFASFPAQSRKFKVIITILQQTLTQLKGAFGEDYMNTIVAAMRNRMVYADVSNFDGKYFSEMFGEKEVYQEGQSEQSVSPLQDNPVSRSGSSYSKTREAALSSSDVLFQEAFECAVKIVLNNKSMPVEQIQANFVPKEEFKEAVIKVNPDAMAEWIENRYKALEGPIVEEDLTELEYIAPPELEDNQKAGADNVVTAAAAEQIHFAFEKPIEQKPTAEHLSYKSDSGEEPGKSEPSFNKIDVEASSGIFVPRRREKKKDSVPITPMPQEKETPISVKTANDFIKSPSELNPVNYSDGAPKESGQRIFTKQEPINDQVPTAEKEDTQFAASKPPKTEESKKQTSIQPPPPPVTEAPYAKSSREMVGRTKTVTSSAVLTELAQVDKLQPHKSKVEKLEGIELNLQPNKSKTTMPPVTTQVEHSREEQKSTPTLFTNDSSSQDVKSESAAEASKQSKPKKKVSISTVPFVEEQGTDMSNNYVTSEINEELEGFYTRLNSGK